MEVIQHLGIQTVGEYRKRYKEDPRLLSTPNRTYTTDWKGWPHFLGKTT
ncbi:MAG: hypothetical protein NUV81_01320 [bacterium]|nr:hypothetical protein [bacterium]